MRQREPNSMLLRQIIEKSAQHLRSDLNSRIIKHPGESGRAKEQAIASFLREQIPGNYEISTGFAFDVDGHSSDQLDLVISNPAAGGAYEIGGGVKYFRAESVVAVGQVKSRIGSRRELWDAFENLRSAAILDRTVGGNAVDIRTGETIDHRANHLHRMFTFLFVAEKGLSGVSSRGVLADFVGAYEHYTWPNLTIFLDSHLLTFRCDEGVCPNTHHARGLTLINDDGLNLLRFVRFLADGVTATAAALGNTSHYLPGLFPVKDEPIFVAGNDGMPLYLADLPYVPLPDYAND